MPSNTNATSQASRSPWLRALLIALLLGDVIFIVAEVLAILDLYSFEYDPILNLVGLSGVSVAISINVALVALALRIWFLLASRRPPMRWLLDSAMVIGLFLLLWVADYCLVERPITRHLATSQREEPRPDWQAADEADFANFSITRAASDPAAKRQIRAMYERIRLNDESTYRHHPIGATIDKFAARYNVDTATLFFLNYIDSWYGEAASGPVPFLSSMTPETIRDLVQVHLPSWFVESSIRHSVINSSALGESTGGSIGFKLRYAIHKATLDVSLAPYAINIYSDIFLVLREYPEEFPELFGSGERDPLQIALSESFVKIRQTALIPPYENPYAPTAYTDEYYDAHRNDLKRFARSTFYYTLQNFDFATRVQALLTKYQTNYYQRRLGADRWNVLPAWQKNSMLLMIRDLYTVNVGHTGYNLYALPELNCTPLEFVATSANGSESLFADPARLWRPDHHDYLWAGAGYRLRVFSHIWALTHGTGLPDIGIEDTTDEAIRVIRSVKGNLGPT